MGHRCYTGQDIKQLQEIKALKEQGLQLKAIRTILPKTGEGEEQSVMNKAQKYIVTMSKDKHITLEDEKSQKAARLQYLLQNMITQAVKTANQELCTDVKESILKELDYQFRMQEERDEERWKQEEEHYRKIDELLRQRQKPKEKAEKGKKKIPIL
jgi:DNA-binding transcriptional MerR regulator